MAQRSQEVTVHPSAETVGDGRRYRGHPPALQATSDRKAEKYGPGLKEENIIGTREEYSS
jgi:hypothetical protein